MAELHSLDLSNNRLTEIPSSLGYSKCLKAISINDNPFSRSYALLSSMLEPLEEVKNKHNSFDPSPRSPATNTLKRYRISSFDGKRRTFHSQTLGCRNKAPRVQDECAILRFLGHLRDQYELESGIVGTLPRPLSSIFQNESTYYKLSPVKLHQAETSQSRRQIIQELFETEKTYVAELQTAFNIYFIPLILEEILDEVQFTTLFSNFHHIFRLHERYVKVTLETS
jgi:RhoGEF domain